MIIITRLTNCGRRVALKLLPWTVPSAYHRGSVYPCVACLKQVDLAGLIPLQIKPLSSKFNARLSQEHAVIDFVGEPSALLMSYHRLTDCKHSYGAHCSRLVFLNHFKQPF